MLSCYFWRAVLGWAGSILGDRWSDDFKWIQTSGQTGLAAIAVGLMAWLARTVEGPKRRES